jgi:hypothetical protein
LRPPADFALSDLDQQHHAAKEKIRICSMACAARPQSPSFADFDRDLIRERTGEGRTRAMANGVKFGRKRKLSDYQRAEAIKRRDGGETLAAIAKSYGVAISMISRL